jgi:predicted  nucleic acid-binding Zn-ribbon protein
MEVSTERPAAVLEGLQQLIDLQTLDDELSATVDEQAGLPGRRSELAETREAVQQRVVSAEQALHEAEGVQRRAEGTLQDQEALVQKLEGQQFQVKTNEAYTALLREIEHAREAISECETHILEAMDSIEAAGSEGAAARRDAERTLSRVSVEEQAIDVREGQLAARIAELRQGRAVLCERLDGELLEQYEKIAARRRPVVVRVREEMCLGCRVNIPAQLQIELLRGARLITCSNCHRILIHEGHLEALAK